MIRAMMPDGNPHPFVAYGPETQWIETEIGVFNCQERLVSDKAEVCRIVDCDWETQHHTYSEELETNRNNPKVYGYAPRVTLKCKRCGCVAHPWKLWEEK